MLDTSRAQWEISKEEKYALDWFERNGFDAVLEKQFLSKTNFSVSKNGVTDKFSLPHGEKVNVKKVMEQFARAFELLCELQELRKQARKEGKI